MDKDSWMEVRKEPKLSPEEVLAQAEESRRKNQEFKKMIARRHREMAQHHFYSNEELCEMGQEDFVRDMLNGD